MKIFLKVSNYTQNLNVYTQQMDKHLIENVLRTYKQQARLHVSRVLNDFNDYFRGTSFSDTLSRSLKVSGEFFIHLPIFDRVKIEKYLLNKSYEAKIVDRINVVLDF